MTSEVLYQIALSLSPNIGPVHARLLVEKLGTATDIFHTREWHLKKIDGIGEAKAKSIRSFDLKRAEEELQFISKFGIRTLFLTDASYPRRLLNCYDAPTLLYYRGKADLNVQRLIAVIGTRNHTDYGRQITEKFIESLVDAGITIVSGLAHGIDGIAHKSALKNHLPTIGVLAHGLDQIYPSRHASLAKEMILQDGGLLTEFPSKTMPDKHNFPSRNRIVAGMCDATIVIETGVKGGSIITAELANGYNKDVFAFPGKVTDTRSAGCNQLIRNNKALLISEAKDLLEIMSWDDQDDKKKHQRQRQLFIQLSSEEELILTLIREKDPMHIDEINLRSGLSYSTVAAAILSMELQGVLSSRPGKLYSLR